MVKLVLEEAKEFTLLPVDSILHLKVEEISVRDIEGRNGTWQKLEFKFKILGIQAAGDGSPREQYDNLLGTMIWGSIPARFTDSAENKLKQWAEAILGMELGVGFELDTDLFVGRECRGITIQYDKRNKDSQGNPFKGAQVDSLLPRAQQQYAPQQQQYAPQQFVQQPPAPQYQQQQFAPPSSAPAQDPWSGQPAQPAPAGNVGWEEPPF